MKIGFVGLGRMGQPIAARLLQAGHALALYNRTLDSVIETSSGLRLIASEFFDEDAPDFDHPLGEPVRVGWVADWETVLPRDTAGTRGCSTSSAAPAPG